MALPTVSPEAIEKTDQFTEKFSGLATGVSSSCDLMGTISALKDKITEYVVEAVTGTITEIKVAVSEVVSDIKGKLSEMFAGSGGILNTIKGYIKDAQEIAQEIAAKAQQISDAVMQQLQDLMDTINDGIQFVSDAVQSAIDAVMDAVSAVRDVIADAVEGIKMGMCSVLSSVLAGTPEDAFSNITEGATDVATKSLGAVKDVYNTGADSILAVTDAVSESGGMSTAVTGLQDAAKSTAGIAGGAVGATTTAMGNSITSMRTILAGIA